MHLFVYWLQTTEAAWLREYNDLFGYDAQTTSPPFDSVPRYKWRSTDWFNIFDKDYRLPTRPSVCESHFTPEIAEIASLTFRFYLLCTAVCSLSIAEFLHKQRYTRKPSYR